MNDAVSPWVARYKSYDNEQIRQLLRHQPKPIKNVKKLSLEKGYALLESAFDSVFVANEQAVKIASRLLNSACTHSEVIYPSSKKFVKDCYASDLPLNDEVRPLCITGLAGVGKTTLVRAIQRILPIASAVDIEGQGHFPLNSDWLLSVKGNTSITKILFSLLESEKYYLNQRASVDELIDKIRNKAHRHGISLLFIDELQFLAQSSGASTNIVKTLKTLCRIGVPTVYIANFSLGHKLKSRPQEDRQRLMSDAIVMLPDLPNSQDWIDTIKGYRDICPEMYKIDMIKDTDKVFGWTAGNKRQLKLLLLHAYRIACEYETTVDIRIIEQAYNSTEFSINREDIEAMNTLWATGKAGRKDLESPFSLPKHEVQQLKEARIEQMKEKIVRESLESSMTIDERSTLSELTQAANKKNAKNTRKAHKKTKNNVTVLDLKRNDELLSSN